MITEEQLSKWHPIGFKRDPLASRGWGSLVESGGESITFEELVARYNALLVDVECLRDEANSHMREWEACHAIMLQVREASADALRRGELRTGLTIDAVYALVSGIERWRSGYYFVQEQLDVATHEVERLRTELDNLHAEIRVCAEERDLLE